MTRRNNVQCFLQVDTVHSHGVYNVVAIYVTFQVPVSDLWLSCQVTLATSSLTQVRKKHSVV